MELRCDRCDLPLAYCVHGKQATDAARAARVEWLEVSPARVAHYPGCPHKDDTDFTRWGRIEQQAPRAWERIGNGATVASDAGARVGLEAVSRCRDCLGHGPW
ncbi:hypothetical protein [Blastococcus sp. SYSU D00820]